MAQATTAMSSVKVETPYATASNAPTLGDGPVATPYGKPFDHARNANVTFHAPGNGSYYRNLHTTPSPHSNQPPPPPAPTVLLPMIPSDSEQNHEKSAFPTIQHPQPAPTLKRPAESQSNPGPQPQPSVNLPGSNFVAEVRKRRRMSSEERLQRR